MSRLDFCVYDYETTDSNPYTCQPIQLAAVMIDGRTLKIKSNGKFESMINIVPDDKVDLYGLGKLNPDALAVNHKTLEEINKAPSLKTVWSQFTEWFNGHNYTDNKYSAPICVGFNNMRFDDIISARIMGGHLRGKAILSEKPLAKTKQKALSVEELAKEYKNLPILKEPWKFGPFNEKRNQQGLFHPIHNIDLLPLSYVWHESNRDVKRHSLDSYREYYGMSSEGAHDALVDVMQTAEILVRFLRLHRKVSQDVEFVNRCKKGMILK